MSQVKFKIGFTIPADTMFDLIAKLLPIEDFSVEELPIKTLAERAIAIAHRPKLKRQTHKRASPGPNLKNGINGIIMMALSDGGLKRAVELQPKVKAAGFSENSVNSRLEALRSHGVIEQIGDGRWKLKDVG
jgi:hypothetical protein